MTSALILCSIIVLSATYCNSANILAIIPSPSYSHQVAHQQLWKDLSLRGHQVTVLTTDPLNDSALSNLTEIDFHYAYEIMNKKFNWVDIINMAESDTIKHYNQLIEVQKFIIEEELGHPSVQALIKNEVNRKFDVIFVEYAYPIMYAFAELYKCPLIVISSMDVPPSMYNTMGNPINPSTYPDMMILSTVPPLNFKERLTSTVFQVASSVLLKYILIPTQDTGIKKYFGDDFPAFSEIKKRISLIFINVDPIFNPIKPLIPTIIPIGGKSNIQEGKPLPKKLEYFIGNATEGVIYFSLGTNVRSGNIKESTLKIILEVFEELPYEVVWKFDSKFVKDPNDLYISSWLPQSTILKNPKVKLFITQGGQQSLEESIYNHVPILGIPFFGDQMANVKRMVTKGIGLSLDHKTMTKQSLKEAILEIINNPKYRNKVKELAELAEDQPMTGLERAIWWTEYVIRHNGTSHFRSPFIDLPAYQYYHLDVLIFCLFVIYITIFVCVKVLKLLWGLTKHRWSSKQKIL